jgi:hypothetical protein
VHLDGPVDHPAEGLGHEVLGHGGFVAELQLGVDEVGAVQHHELALVQLDRGVGDHPLDPLLLRQQRAVRIAVERAIDHHLQRRLGLADPAHAVGQAGRPQPVLAQQVALAPPTEHLRGMQPEVVDADLAVVVAAGEGVHVAHDLPAFVGQVDQERRIGRLGQLGIVLRAGDEDGELRPAGAGDEPLVALDDPLVAVGVGAGLDQRGVGAGNLGLGHGEAAAGAALAQRLQVLLLLPVGPPVQQRVHIPLVRRLGVERERAHA